MAAAQERPYDTALTGSELRQNAQFAEQLGRIAAQNRIDESGYLLSGRFRVHSVNRIVSDVGGLLGGSIEIKAEFFDFVRHQGPVSASQFSDPPADVSGEAQPRFAADGSGKLFGIPPLRRIAGKSQHLFVIQRQLENFRTCLERAAYGDYWIARLGGLKQPLDGRQRFISRRSEEHTSELQSLMRISYAVFCLKKKNHLTNE